tara:strand:+ start:2510 stop:3328 length:819 start_codon:yes stop_codon:yes gene_type:complete
MSKVVKKIGRSIKKVVKGVAKGVKKVWKKIKQSKVLKVIATAALIYFGGAALMGGIGGAAGGGGISGALSGAAQGMGNAWGSLSAAGSSVMSGNFGAAGSNLMAGVQGQTINAATGAVTGVASGGANALLANTPITQAGARGFELAAGRTSPLNPASGVASEASKNALRQRLGMGLPEVATQGLQEGAKQGLLGTVMSSPYTAPALISTGGNMIAGYAQGAQQQEMLDQQQQQQEEQRDIYNANVGTVLNMPVFNPQTGRYETPQNTTTLGV